MKSSSQTHLDIYNIILSIIICFLIILHILRKEERSFFCYEVATSKISDLRQVETLIIISNTIINNNETLYNYISHPPTAFHHKIDHGRAQPPWILSNRGRALPGKGGRRGEANSTFSTGKRGRKKEEERGRKEGRKEGKGGREEGMKEGLDT